MGSGSKSGGGGGGGVQGPMPPETRKMVQRLKEILNNFSETEIHATLKECNMDPDATVQRLLSEDTFHEVKSKRERRKETKETQDTRYRGNNTSSNHGAKGASERNLGRSATSHANANDYGNVAYKRDNGSVSPTLYSCSSSAPHISGKSLHQQPSPQGDSFGADEGRQSIGTVDGISSSGQQHPGVQSAWSGGTRGQISMADIVRMGRPQSKPSEKSTEVPLDVIASFPSDYCVKAPHTSASLQPDTRFPSPSYVPERINEASIDYDQHALNDEWPVIEQPATTTVSPVLDVSTVPDADIYSNQSSLYVDGGNTSSNCLPHDVQVSNGGVAREDLRYDLTRSASIRQNFVNSTGEASHHADDTLNAAKLTYESLEGCGSIIPSRSHSVPRADDNIITVSSAAEELEHLSLGKEDHVKSPTGDNCMVVFPDNLQALAADCSHLSFGTYKPSNGTAFPVPPASDPQKTDMEEASAAMDGSSAGGLDTRYLGYDAEAPIGSFFSTHKATADAGKYDLSVTAQPELVKERISEATYGHEHISPFPVPDSSYENIQQSSALPFAKPDQTSRSQPSFQNAELGYSNPRPTDLLAPTVESLRGSDLQQLEFLQSQLLASRYGGAVSATGSPSISMAEVLNSGTILPQQSLPTVPGAMGPGLQQHHSGHTYPQSSLNVEHLANMIGYPSALPQSQGYPYKPSGVQESYPGGSSLQSLADLKYGLQQYKSGASFSNLPFTNASASGYGSYGNSTNIPGSFLHNPSGALTAANTDGYDLFLSQYKDATNFTPPLRQIDGSTWDYAAGLRTMSSVPSSAYYSLQAQNQQHDGYRQHQPASQQYAAPGYPDFYHSQTRIPQEYQRQSLGDLAVDSQIPSSKQQQFWQQRY